MSARVRFLIQLNKPGVFSFAFYLSAVCWAGRLRVAREPAPTALNRSSSGGFSEKKKSCSGGEKRLSQAGWMGLAHLMQGGTGLPLPRFEFDTKASAKTSSFVPVRSLRLPQTTLPTFLRHKPEQTIRRRRDLLRPPGSVSTPVRSLIHTPVFSRSGRPGASLSPPPPSRPYLI